MEEEKKICVGEANIRLIAVNSTVKIEGTFAKIPRKVAQQVCDAIVNVNCYNTKIQQVADTATLIFTDPVGCDVDVDELLERLSIMQAIMGQIGDVILAISRLKAMSKDYDGMLRKTAKPVEKQEHKNEDEDEHYNVDIVYNTPNGTAVVISDIPEEVGIHAVEQLAIAKSAKKSCYLRKHEESAEQA